VERFPEIAQEAKGRDPEYMRWYREVLVATEPHGLMYADWPSREDRLELFYGSSREAITLPPTFSAEDSFG
jgi:hypothetical protein